MERYFCWPCCGHKHVFHVKVSRHTAHSAHPIKSKTSHTDMGHVAPPVSHVLHRLHGGIASQPWGTWRAAARPSRWRARRQHKSTSGPFSLVLPPPTPHTPPKGEAPDHIGKPALVLGPARISHRSPRSSAVIPPHVAACRMWPPAASPVPVDELAQPALGHPRNHRLRLRRRGGGGG